jgi:hypothetical protein
MKLSKLKQAYKNRLNDTDTIVIDGYEFVPNYLKYLLEYIDMQTKGKKEIEIDFRKDVHYDGQN